MMQHDEPTHRFLFVLPLKRVHLCCIFLFVLNGISNPLHEFCRASDFSSLVENGSFIVEGSVPPLRYSEDSLFIPASTIKVLTALSALELLGDDYRFETHFFMDKKHNLLVKGFGDPFLTSEKVMVIAGKLRAIGVNKVNSIVFDVSDFKLGNITASDEASLNPYDAPNGALGVNFNALPVHVLQDGSINSGEPQTPLLPIITRMGTTLSPGYHRVNVNSANIKSTLPAPLQYTVELLIATLRKQGITVINSYKLGSVPNKLPPLLIYKNDMVLTEIVRACMKYSNNYIANQLFLTCGKYRYGPPATWEKGRNFMAEYIKKNLRLQPSQIVIQEGSGISRNNRVSSTAMIRILQEFKPYAHLLNRRDSVLLKSGSLQGVHCYAGYFQNNSKFTGFTILLNQPQNTRDKLLDMLQKQYLKHLQ